MRAGPRWPASGRRGSRRALAKRDRRKAQAECEIKKKKKTHHRCIIDQYPKGQQWGHQVGKGRPTENIFFLKKKKKKKQTGSQFNR
jgi:hypothetical protein